MLKVRTTKLTSGNTSVQVVHRHNHKTDIIKHIGTARNGTEQKELVQLASEYIATNTQIPPLLPEAFRKDNTDNFLVSLNHLQFTQSFHHFAYEFLNYFYKLNGFDNVNNSLLRDLAIMRIIEPSSKLRAVELLKEYFALCYPINKVYEELQSMKHLKNEVEKVAVSYAKNHLGFDFSIVFYDVTTLYFETFKADEDTQDEQGNKIIGLRKHGFSKDSKPQQPQIVIGLVVNRDGYPISVEIFSGKTFEGHTMLPVIKKLKAKYQIENLTIVADAGMLSLDNIETVKEAKLFYIVGARLGNISGEMLREISQNLNKTEDIYYTTETPLGKLICEYSEKRCAKDKSDRKKQLQRALYQIDNPEKIKRKARFVTEETKATLKLNEELIAQDELKEGIKGYYTNLENIADDLIVKQYKDLWHVEKSFRIAKSDLEARPIFHHKRKSIEAHIIIVFVSLCLTKTIELTTGYSIKKVRDMIWKVLDIELVDTLTDRKFMKRMEITGNKMAELFETITNVDKTSKRVLKK